MSGNKSETYLFMSHPRAVETRRRKYRPPEEVEDELGNTANLMFDPRVLRGVTCGRPASNVLEATVKMQQSPQQPPRPSKKQLLRMGKIRPKQKSVKEIHENIRVEKKRVEVPLHLYLIEQEEEKQTVTVSSQTDAFLEEPPSPKYLPRKTGVDMGVQVEVDEVFNYDKDVAPILEVVISKTLEQSLMEVRQEEELKSISRSKAFLKNKAAMRREEAEKLEQKEKGLMEDKIRIKAEAREKANREYQLQLKIASHVFSERYLAQLEEVTLGELERQNFFVDPITLSVRDFMPWLCELAHDKVLEEGDSRECVEKLLKLAVRKGEERREEANRVKQEKIELARQEAERKAAQEEANRNKEVQLFIHTELVANSPVGPIVLTASATVAMVQQEIIKWLQDNSDDPPPADRLRFLWSGKEVDETSVLHTVGIEQLSNITMELIDD